MIINTGTDTVLTPEAVTFNPVTVRDAHILEIELHDPNHGTVVLPLNKAMSAQLAHALNAFVEQVDALEG